MLSPRLTPTATFTEFPCLDTRTVYLGLWLSEISVNVLRDSFKNFPDRPLSNQGWALRTHSNTGLNPKPSIERLQSLYPDSFRAHAEEYVRRSLTQRAHHHITGWPIQLEWPALLRHSAFSEKPIGTIPCRCSLGKIHMRDRTARRGAHEVFRITRIRHTPRSGCVKLPCGTRLSLPCQLLGSLGLAVRLSHRHCAVHFPNYE
jgi:hypothetical protein